MLYKYSENLYNWLSEVLINRGFNYPRFLLIEVVFTCVPAATIYIVLYTMYIYLLCLRDEYEGQEKRCWQVWQHRIIECRLIKTEDNRTLVKRDFTFQFFCALGFGYPMGLDLSSLFWSRWDNRVFEIKNNNLIR